MEIQEWRDALLSQNLISGSFIESKVERAFLRYAWYRTALLQLLAFTTIISARICYFASGDIWSSWEAWASWLQVANAIVTLMSIWDRRHATGTQFMRRFDRLLSVPVPEITRAAPSSDIMSDVESFESPYNVSWPTGTSRSFDWIYIPRLRLPNRWYKAVVAYSSSTLWCAHICASFTVDNYLPLSTLETSHHGWSSMERSKHSTLAILHTALTAIGVVLIGDRYDMVGATVIIIFSMLLVRPHEYRAADDRSPTGAWVPREQHLLIILCLLLVIAGTSTVYLKRRAFATIVYSKMQLKHLKEADEARAAALEAQAAADRSSLVLKTTQAVHGVTLGIAAHRLNGPLHVSNAIVSDLVQSSLFASQAETVNGLKSALHDMQAHLNEVLQLERFWRLTRKSSAQPADVSAVVEEIEHLVSATMKSHVQATVDGRLPNTVILDPTLLLLSLRTGISALNDIGTAENTGVVLRVQRVWAPALAPQAGAPTELITDSSWMSDYVPEDMSTYLELENLDGPRSDTAHEWIHFEIRARLRGAPECSDQSAQRLIETTPWQTSREWLSTLLKGSKQHLAICCLIAAAQGARVGLVAKDENVNCTGRFFLQLPLSITSERSTDVRRLADKLKHLPLSSPPATATPTPLQTDPAATEITPATDDPQIEPTSSGEATAADTSNTERRLHILVVDDEASVRKVHQRFLNKLGYSSELATDGKDALQRVLSAPTGAAPFDIIMMDIVMPRMGGVEACRELRENGITIPIIAVTANAGMHDRTSYVTAGFTSVLAKPFTMSQLDHAIAEASNC